MVRSTFILLCLLLLPGTTHALDVGVEVSSFKGGKPRLGPENLMDGDVTTAWAANSNLSGSQWIELSFEQPTQVERLGLYNGHQGDRFELHRRIRSGRLIYPDGQEFRFWLRDRKGEQIVHCPGTPVTELRIEIDSALPSYHGEFPRQVALSEIKLYISLAQKPEGSVKDVDALNQVSSNVAGDLELTVPKEIAQLLRKFYHRQGTLAHDYAELFAEDVRDQNDLRFEIFKEMQRQRGTYKMFRNASVNATGLAFEKLEEAGSYMRVRVFGTYRVRVNDLDRILEEDSIYLVTKESEHWKILEIEEE